MVSGLWRNGSVGLVRKHAGGLNGLEMPGGRMPVAFAFGWCLRYSSARNIRLGLDGTAGKEIYARTFTQNRPSRTTASAPSSGPSRSAFSNAASYPLDSTFSRISNQPTRHRKLSILGGIRLFHSSKWDASTSQDRIIETTGTKTDEKDISSSSRNLNETVSFSPSPPTVSKSQIKDSEHPDPNDALGITDHSKDEAESSTDTLPTTIDPSASDMKLSELRRLVRLARPESNRLFSALSLLVFSSSISVTLPFLIGKVMDLFSNPELMSSALPEGITYPIAAGILVGVFLTGSACNFGQVYLMRTSGERIIRRLREGAFGNVARLDMSWFDLQGTGRWGETMTGIGRVKSRTEGGGHGAGAGGGSGSGADGNNVKVTTKEQKGVRSTGDVLSRLGSDTGIMGNSLTRELADGFRSMCIAVGGLGMMFMISTKLTLLMLAIVPPVSIGAVIYGRFLKKLSRRTQKAYGDMTHVAEERLAAIRTVHAFNAINPEISRFSSEAWKIFGLARKEAFANAAFFASVGFVGNTTIIGLLSYGGLLVSRGEISVGSLSSLLLYTVYIGSSLMGLTSFFSTLMRGLGAATRVFELLDARPSSVQLGVGRTLDLAKERAHPREITFKDISFSYPSRPGAQICKNLNLKVEPGMSIAIAGGSGSGKSTIANLLMRYYDPVGGAIYYGTDDIREFKPESWRDLISFVSQEPVLFSGTIIENIRYGKPDATMEEIEQAAKLANLDFVNQLPAGLQTNVGSRAANLSGGQRQRIALARALVRHTPILVLDEATSALDAVNEALVNEAISNISTSKSLTTILVAHRLSTLKTADIIVFMEDGKVSEIGTFEELSKEGSRFRELIKSQMALG